MNRRGFLGALAALPALPLLKPAAALAAPVAAPVCIGMDTAKDLGESMMFARYEHKTVSLAYAITDEEVDEGHYAELGERYTRMLLQSMEKSKETLAANILGLYS